MTKNPRAVILQSVNELVASVTRLVDAMSTAAEATAAPRAAATSVFRAKAKAHWDGLTPRQRAARVRKMLAARGLKPKPKSHKPPSHKSMALRAAIRAHWASMTPAEHQARVRKMLAARGLKPKK